MDFFKRFTKQKSRPEKPGHFIPHDGVMDFGPETKAVDVINAFPHKVKQKNFLLTGLAPGELSAATGEALASGDAATLIFINKSESTAQPAIHAIKHKNPLVRIIFAEADFNSLASVRDAAERVERLGIPLDGIVGFPTEVAGEWRVSEDGVESQFQVNYLAHFLLVNLLGGLVREGGRVVLVSSSVRPEAAAPGFEDVNFEDGKSYHPLDGYAQSMFANILFAKSLAMQKQMNACAVNPGNIKTNLQTYINPELVASWLQKKKGVGEDLPLLIQQAPKSVSQGSATVLRGLLDSDIDGPPGAFLDNCNILSLPNIDSHEGQERAMDLWKRSEELVGEKFSHKN